MKKIFLFLVLSSLFLLSGCGGESQDKTPVEPEKKSVEKAPVETSSDKKILVA